MSTREEAEAELRALDGYTSDTKFVAAFADEGVNKDLSNIIVINGLPCIPESKHQKLVDVMRTKLFGTLVGLVVGEKDIFMPVNEEKKETEGFAFIELANKEDADKAAAALDNADFDKQHKLRVVKYNDFQGYKKIGDEFVPPPMIDYQPKADLYNWLMDESCRDQMAIRFSNSERSGPLDDKHETEILWAEARGPPALDYGGEMQKATGKNWTEKLVAWSPRGTYFTTLHPQGAKVWSGRGFKDSGMKLSHDRVNEVLWSPDEKWVATWNGCASNQHPDRAFIVWNAITGQEAKAFRQRRVQDEKPEFVWSADGKYLARVFSDANMDVVAVYETPTFKMIDAKKAPGARDLCWCPKKHNLLSWWTPEKDDNTPTSVQVMKLPGKEYVRQRQLYSVESCTFFWHPQGEYHAVVAEKLTKGQARKKKAEAKTGEKVDRKQTAGFNIEIMRLKDKNMNVEVLDVKEVVHTFAWESNGNRFALLSGDGLHKFNVVVYQMEKERGCTQLFTLEDRPCNGLHWSPRGEILLMVGLDNANMGGALEFYDVERRKTLATTAHEQASSVAWDPSGRIVATYKTQPIGGSTAARQTVGNGYMLWNFQGTRLYSTERAKFFQLSWRPRPDSLLSEEEVKDTAKNLKKHITRYLQEDKQRESRRVLLGRLKKLQERQKFRGMLHDRLREWEDNRELRIELGAEETDDNAQVYEDFYEIFLGETVTVMD